MTRQKTRNSYKIDTKLILLYAFFLIFPLFIQQLLFWLSGYGVKLFHIIPVMNDEVSWWSQINSIVKSGQPLGYYGYNGTHAPVGTNGPWGLAPLLPYALFGKIFGWQIHSMAYANIMFLSIAGFVFCLLAKPNRKQLRWIFIMYACSFLTIGYSLTAMAEGLRYAVGIVLIGIIVWLRENAPEIKNLKIKHIFIYLTIIVALFYAINVYLIFALVAVLVAWFMLKGTKPGLRILLCIVFTLICTFAAYKLTARYIAPFTTSTIKNLLDLLHDEGVYKAFCALFTDTLINLQSVSLFNTIHLDIDIVQWYIVMYNAILILTTFYFIKHIARKKSQKADSKAYVEIFSGNSFLVIFLLLGFVVGYCALYTGSYWTLCRGTNTALLMSFLLIALGEREKDSDPEKFRTLRVVVLSLTIAGFAMIWGYYQSNVTDRYESMDRIAIIEDEKKELAKVIEISPEKDVWDNTIAHYGDLDNYYLALPDSAGINSMSDGVENKEAKYVIYRKTEWEEKQEDWEKLLKKSNHKKIFEDDLFVVYEKGEGSADGNEK